MARYQDEYGFEGRYGPIEDESVGGIPADFVQIVTGQQNRDDISQNTPDQITANQNNYSLPVVEIVRLSTDASRTITGFAGARVGRFVIVNVGSQNLVIANNSGSSDAQNRVLCHTGADITLNANESVTIFYDYTSTMWRTVGFV